MQCRWNTPRRLASQLGATHSPGHATHGSVAVSNINTLNICVSHLPFPRRFDRYVDLMLTPASVIGPSRVIQVKDDVYGVNGHALSEYAQLFWLHDHLESFTDGYEYIRLFQYRRFVSRVPLGDVSWNSFSTWISPSRLEKASSEFDRFSAGELFNPAVIYQGGVPFQYAMSHVLEDLLNFTKYIIEQNILTHSEVVEFLTSDRLITACSTGIYSVKHFRDTFAKLKKAAEFINSSYYIPRSGIQRRVGGFLLERLHSYLLLRYLQDERGIQKFGHYIMIDDGRILTRVKRRIYGYAYWAAIKVGDMAQKHLAAVRIGNRVRGILTEI